MLLFIRVDCQHCNNKKWWKAERISKDPKISQFICPYCGFVWWE